MNVHMPADATAIVNLEALGAELRKLGWQSWLFVAAGRLPSLVVQNREPGVSATAESIYFAPRADGWWFWWSWVEPIAETPAEAAHVIFRALRSANAP